MILHGPARLTFRTLRKEGRAKANHQHQAHSPFCGCKLRGDNCELSMASCIPRLPHRLVGNALSAYRLIPASRRDTEVGCYPTKDRRRRVRLSSRGKSGHPFFFEPVRQATKAEMWGAENRVAGPNIGWLLLNVIVQAPV